MNIEGLAVHSLATELDRQLAGGRITKIFQPTRFLFLIKIRLLDTEPTLAISMDPADSKVYLTSQARENPTEPSSLCMFLRKHLLDGRIAAINQQAGLDRVLHLHIDLREGQGRILTRTLTLELAGKNCNLILTENGIIMDALRRVGHNTSRVRQIVPGIPYLPPPIRARLNPLEQDGCAIVTALVQGSTLPLPKALMATVDGIGPIGVKEILFRAGIDETHFSSTLTPIHQKTLAESIDGFVKPMKVPPTVSYVAMDASRRLMAVANFEPTHLAAPVLKSFDSIDAAIAFASSLSAAPRTTLQFDTARRVGTELDKLERKLEVLQQEWQVSQNAEDFRRQADLLMANLHLIKQGQKQIVVSNFFSENSSEEEHFVEISLDPALLPMDNIQRTYKKYSRAKRAQELIYNQINHCRQDILYLEGIAFSLSDLVSNQELQEIIQELGAGGYLQAGKPSRSLSKPSEPRKVSLPSGAVIFIGRNNRQNDIVTFKTAQPRDLWFHTKDIPGSHVVLRSNNATPQLPDIEKAALLAAWFSKARYSANVPVDFTERRHVKKPSGAKPGFVIYEKQKTLWVTTDQETVDQLVQEPVRSSIPR